MLKNSLFLRNLKGVVKIQVVQSNSYHNTQGCSSLENVGGWEVLKGAGAPEDTGRKPQSWATLRPVRNLVPPARFQRATFRLGGGRSMQLSYGSTKNSARIQESEVRRKWLRRQLCRRRQALLSHSQIA
jgi:hypothetical protein